jgi:iron complex outermembrane receptor protein
MRRKPVIPAGVCCAFAACLVPLAIEARCAIAQEQKPPEVALPAITVTSQGNASPKKPSKAPAKLSAKSASSQALPDAADEKRDGGLSQSTAGTVDGYRALTAVSATGVETPLEEVPQSIQVVPRSLIDDQTPRGIDEAVQNVSAVQATARLQTPAYDNARIRGFLGEQWLDGLPVFYNPGFRDALAHVERVEVIKGPNAVLYGGSFGAPIGGVINVVSKLPFDKARMEFGGTVGSDSYYRSHFDLNQPVAADGSVLFRMTGEYLNAGSFIDEIETDAYSINPTLILNNLAGTKLTLQARATRWQQPEYQGLPAVGTVAGDFRIDPHMYINARDAPDAFSRHHALTATLDHRISDGVDATVKARWSQSTFGEYGQIIIGSDGIGANAPLVPPSSWLLSNGLLEQEQEEMTVAGNVRMKFADSFSKSTLMVGADHSRITDRGDLYLDAALGGAGLIDLNSPSFAFPYVAPPRSPATTFEDEAATYVNQGVYVQIQSMVADRLHLLGGLRLADLEINHTDFIDSAHRVAHETRLLPRFGALVELTEQVSAYASYSEGLQGSYLFSQRGLPEPEFSQQREAGLKFDLAGGFTGSVAVFEIDRSGVPVVVNLQIVGDSRERARGVEFDSVWQPDRNWSVVSSYAFVDAVLLDSNGAAMPGVRRVGVPEHSGRLWINYAFDPGMLNGWSVGAGFYAATNQAVDLANIYFTDSFMTVDAKVTYATDAFTVTASAKNLLDEDYFVSHFYLGGRVAPGDDKAYYLTVSRTY